MRYKKSRPSLKRNPLVFVVSECEIHVLQALRRSPLQQIVDGDADDYPLAARMYREASDLLQCRKVSKVLS